MNSSAIMIVLWIVIGISFLIMLSLIGLMIWEKWLDNYLYKRRVRININTQLSDYPRWYKSRNIYKHLDCYHTIYNNQHYKLWVSAKSKWTVYYGDGHEKKCKNIYETPIKLEIEISNDDWDLSNSVAWDLNSINRDYDSVYDVVVTFQKGKVYSNETQYWNKPLVSKKYIMKNLEVFLMEYYL